MNTLASRRPRRLLLTVRLGELPEHVPSWSSSRRYGVAPADHIDGGPIDRLLRHHGGALRCTRQHTARTPHDTRPGVVGARRFDDIEQLSGVARVLRVEVADDRAMPSLVEALAQVDRVENVSPDRLCGTPFDAVSHAGLTPGSRRRPCACRTTPSGAVTGLQVRLAAPAVIGAVTSRSGLA